MTSHPYRSWFVLAGVVASLSACADAGLTSPGAPAGPSAASALSPARLVPGAYYLRSVDDRPLPLGLANGLQLASGFVVADSTDAQLVGWGESVGRADAGSVRLTTGTARVLAGAPHGGSQVATISWRNAAATRDSVSWSRDSVIVHRSAAGLSAAGAGRRLVYTRATAADTL